MSLLENKSQSRFRGRLTIFTVHLTTSRQARHLKTLTKCRHSIHCKSLLKIFPGFYFNIPLFSGNFPTLLIAGYGSNSYWYICLIVPQFEQSLSNLKIGQVLNAAPQVSNFQTSLLFVVFSAYGGIPTGNSMLFFTSWERVDCSCHHHQKIALLC